MDAFTAPIEQVINAAYAVASDPALSEHKASLKWLSPVAFELRLPGGRVVSAEFQGGITTIFMFVAVSGAPFDYTRVPYGEPVDNFVSALMLAL